MIALASLSLRFWEIVSEVGFVIVIVGVVGEGAELAVKWIGKRNFRKKLNKIIRRLLVHLLRIIEPRLLEVETVFFSLLVFGLALEFWGGQRAMRIADRENAILNVKAGQAVKDAAAANERAASVESNNAALLLRVEELRATNLALQAKLAGVEAKLQTVQTRRITTAQRDAFIKYTKDLPKGPVRIFVCAGPGEPLTYAHHVRDMLDASGYRADKDGGITEINGLTYSGPIGDPGQDAPLGLYLYGTNNVSLEWPGIIFTRVGQYTLTRYDPAVGLPIPIVINAALQSIGINAGWLAEGSILKPGEWGIFIHKKF